MLWSVMVGPGSGLRFQAWLLLLRLDSYTMVIPMLMSMYFLPNKWFARQTLVVSYHRVYLGRSITILSCERWEYGYWRQTVLWGILPESGGLADG